MHGRKWSTRQQPVTVVQWYRVCTRNYQAALGHGITQLAEHFGHTRYRRLWSSGQKAVVAMVCSKSTFVVNATGGQQAPPTNQMLSATPRGVKGLLRQALEGVEHRYLAPVATATARVYSIDRLGMSSCYERL